MHPCCVMARYIGFMLSAVTSLCATKLSYQRAARLIAPGQNIFEERVSRVHRAKIRGILSTLGTQTTHTVSVLSEVTLFAKTHSWDEESHMNCSFVCCQTVFDSVTL